MSGNTEYGIWNELDGGFEECGFRTRIDAENRIGTLIEQAPDEEAAIDVESALSVLPLCPDHEEQPLLGCEECDTDEEQDETDDEEG